MGFLFPIDLRSYTFVKVLTGFYGKDPNQPLVDANFYTVEPRFYLFVGLTPWCDLNLIPSVVYNTTSSEHGIRFGDFTVGLDFQLLEKDKYKFIPGIKLAIREVFPTGAYEHLRSKKLRTDESGKGSFESQVNLVFYKEFASCLTTTLSLQGAVKTPVNVHGFNAYGGGFGTKGKALPGFEFEGIFSFEYAFTKHVAFSLDNVYNQACKTEYFGLPGISFEGKEAKNGTQSSWVYSLAPAIEYNFSDSFGIILGSWVSVTGKNTEIFRNFVINFDANF